MSGIISPQLIPDLSSGQIRLHVIKWLILCIAVYGIHMKAKLITWETTVTGLFQCNMFMPKLPKRWMFLEDAVHDLW